MLLFDFFSHNFNHISYFSFDLGKSSQSKMLKEETTSQFCYSDMVESFFVWLSSSKQLWHFVSVILEFSQLPITMGQGIIREPIFYIKATIWASEMFFFLQKNCCRKKLIALRNRFMNKCFVPRKCYYRLFIDFLVCDHWFTSTENLHQKLYITAHPRPGKRRKFTSSGKFRALQCLPNSDRHPEDDQL